MNHPPLSAIGKHVAGQHYVHVSGLLLLSERDQQLTRLAMEASDLAPDRDFNVIRVSEDGEGRPSRVPGFL